MQNAQKPSEHIEYPTAATLFNISLRKLFTSDHEDEKQRVNSLFAPILTLCPLSFCAYDNAKADDGWLEFTEDGCTVQHLSWDCLKLHVKEVLRIRLERARHLPAPNANVSGGRYFVFSTGSSRERSEDKWDDSDPWWRTSHYLFIKHNFQVDEDSSKLHIELHNSDPRDSQNNTRPLVHKSRRAASLRSASIAMSEVLKDEESTHTPRIELKGSIQSNRDASVIFHTQRISLKVAWTEARRGKEPPDAWKQHMPKSQKGYDWALSSIGNISVFKPIGFIDAVKRGTQVWVYADLDTKTIAIAFRGTERRKWEDVCTVSQFLPSKLHWESTGSCNLNTTLDKEDDGMMVHAGFEKAYRAVRVALLELVYSITNWSKDWTVCITGHSLGGALAVLCSFDYAHLEDHARSKPKVFMMSFGAPRVGNKLFKDAYKEAVKHGYRVAAGKDIICTLPIHFHHGGQELRFDTSGLVRLNKKLITNVKLEAESIESEMIEEVIRGWNCRVKRKRSIRRQPTTRDRWVQAMAFVQEETSRRTLLRSMSSRRCLVEPTRARVVNRSISRRSLLSAPSVQLKSLHLNQGSAPAPLVPSFSHHSEKCYHHFASWLARRARYSMRHMHRNGHRSAEKFRSLIRTIQDKLTQQEESNSANQQLDEYE